MTDRFGCDEVRSLAGELALGVASGHERALAIEHLAGCGACRREVGDLTDVADRLLVLGPVTEPPVGFEARVIERIRRADAAGAPRWRRSVALVLAAALGAAVAVAGIWRATSGQRERAGQYARALQTARGTYFGALALRDREGRRAGTLFVYEGRPSWVLAIIDSPGVSGTYGVELVARDGSRSRLGALTVTEGRGTFGADLPGSLRAVEAVRLLSGGAPAFEAVLPSPGR